MIKIYYSILNLGVHNGLSDERKKRVQMTNFLETFTLLFYSVYFLLGVIIGSNLWIMTTFSMILSGAFGLYMNHLRKYGVANISFIGAFGVLLGISCNSLNNGWDFMIFFLPSLFSYVIIYDYEKDFLNALLNLSITAVSIIAVFLLPKNMLFQVVMPEKWVAFFHIFNYCMAFSISLSYMLFIANHINQNARKMQRLWMEAERQKEAYLEERNRAEAATATKSQFLSNMSHELRTPLNGIIGTVQIMLQDEVLDSQKQHFKVLKYSSEHMISLINDVLDFSKIEAGQMDLSSSPFNLKESMEKLQTVFEKQFEERHVQLSFDISDSLNRDFVSDETRLNQVLTNLLSNALKFIKKGSVTCKAQLINSTSQSAEIYFSVEDTGIGISTINQKKIFEAFRQAESSTTRRFGGTGLGLTISKKIVSMLGGTLEVNSEEGKGSSFFFTLNLPISQQKVNFLNQKKASGLKSLKGIRVLTADDSSVNRRITRNFLERWEVEMDEAVDGKEALQLFLKNKYDLLLIDLHMPVMDGYETIAAIRQVDKDIPALAFTAAVLPDMHKKLVNSGFSDYLQKPFRPENLHHKIITTAQTKDLSA